MLSIIHEHDTDEHESVLRRGVLWVRVLEIYFPSFFHTHCSSPTNTMSNLKVRLLWKVLENVRVYVLTESISDTNSEGPPARLDKKDYIIVRVLAQQGKHDQWSLGFARPLLCPSTDFSRPSHNAVMMESNGQWLMPNL